MSHSRTANRNLRRTRLVIDQLENRITPSVTWSLSADGTEFTVNSDDAADRVFVSFNASNVLTLAVRSRSNVVFNQTVATLVEFEYFGNGGDDILRADNVRAGITVNADGGSGNDALHGGDGNDVFFGGLGNDTLNGQGGDDQLFGNEDNDRLVGDDGDDDLVGGGGDDFLAGNRGNDELFGEDGNDELRGGVGDDILNGGGNDDLLDAGAGNDALFGESGNDVLQGDAGNDWLEAGEGADSYSGGAGVDTLQGIDAEDVQVFGGRNGDLFNTSIYLDLTDFLTNFAGAQDYRSGVDSFESSGGGGGGGGS